jgi:hypothetical protein
MIILSASILVCPENDFMILMGESQLRNRYLAELIIIYYALLQ